MIQNVSDEVAQWLHRFKIVDVFPDCSRADVHEVMESYGRVPASEEELHEFVRKSPMTKDGSYRVLFALLEPRGERACCHSGCHVAYWAHVGRYNEIGYGVPKHLIDQGWDGCHRYLAIRR